MEVDFLPEHLMIIGGSYIGLKFAQMYRRIGSKVTVAEMKDQLIARDDDMSETIQEILDGEGLTSRLQADCIEARATDSGIAVRVSCNEGPQALTGLLQSAKTLSEPWYRQ